MRAALPPPNASPSVESRDEYVNAEERGRPRHARVNADPTGYPGIKYSKILIYNIDHFTYFKIQVDMYPCPGIIY